MIITMTLKGFFKSRCITSSGIYILSIVNPLTWYYTVVVMCYTKNLFAVPLVTSRLL